ncbi:hypothetical protein ARMGADRAFT_750575 [Armillaria gallica]|uniref:Uncharacterized protein n=1 Tax=Armillaria gallica TaxID=47427 RepID=A0A2H3E5L4_ARMGA|nr:hypothetical protein ARMGADRAFT_750575 [Armillaria gallica]
MACRHAEVHSHSLPSPTPSALGSRKRISVHDSHFPGHNAQNHFGDITKASKYPSPETGETSRPFSPTSLAPNRKHEHLNPVHLHPYRTWPPIHFSSQRHVHRRTKSWKGSSRARTKGDHFHRIPAPENLAFHRHSLPSSSTIHTSPRHHTSTRMRRAHPLPT